MAGWRGDSQAKGPLLHLRVTCPMSLVSGFLFGVVYWFLCVACCLFSFVVFCLLFVVGCWLLFVVACLLLIVCC